MERPTPTRATARASIHRLASSHGRSRSRGGTSCVIGSMPTTWRRDRRLLTRGACTGQRHFILAAAKRSAGAGSSMRSRRGLADSVSYDRRRGRHRVGERRTAGLSHRSHCRRRPVSRRAQSRRALRSACRTGESQRMRPDPHGLEPEGVVRRRARTACGRSTTCPSPSTREKRLGIVGEFWVGEVRDRLCR